MVLTGADIFAEVLVEQGVETLFGYPGGAVLNLYDALYKYSGKIRHIMTAHEQGAAHAADGYARATGKTGVVLATSGPGATNLVTGIATAYMDSIPIVAITGQVQSFLLGRDIFQEVDITGATAPFVKNSYLVKDAAELPRIVKEAFYIASSGRPGPVLIDVPVDIQEQVLHKYTPCDSVNIRGYKPSREGNPKQIKRVSETISSASRPLFVVGGGIFSAHARTEIRKLSELSGIPVVTTMMGLGALPTSHPMNLGMIGSFGHKSANMAMDQTDLVIMVGARAGDRAIPSPDKVDSSAKTIHIDVDPAEVGKNVSATVPLVGDVKLVLQKLIEESPKADCSQWTSSLVNAAQEKKNQTAEKRENSIGPKRFMRELGSQLEKDAFVVADVGQNQIWAAKHIPIQDGRFLTTGGLGTMGYSLPAAIGVKIAEPKRQTVVVCGDGSFQMMNNELSTLVSQGLDVKIILLNNRVLGMVNELQRISHLHQFGVQMPETPDYQMLSASYGIKSRRISHDSEMAAAISEMLDYNGPYLLECMVSPDEGSKSLSWKEAEKCNK